MVVVVKEMEVYQTYANTVEIPQFSWMGNLVQVEPIQGRESASTKEKKKTQREF